MVRVYTKKKDKPPPTDGEIVAALLLIKTSGKSLREVALIISGIPKSTLCDYSKRFPDFSNLTPDIKIKPKFHHLQVLKPTHEQELADYLIRTPKSHGLTPPKAETSRVLLCCF
jgi:hypothetical protein